MKLIENINELKKGDSIIIKDNSYFLSQGLSKVKGEVFLIDKDHDLLTVKCTESNSIERVSLTDGKFFLV
jgi:hypothetical protein